jgi:DNA invertase Pin-like site-specific DNA recombinase
MGSQSRRLRSAVYTRKSTEEGLDKAFNSLDAQREACTAYVMSQQHEGWTLLPDLYDDGGYSGGSMDRPALQQLLEDVGAGKVDVVVVYKIDRLTRSLSDFAKIVDVLDAADASFVSVTQAFSTTTSMGRLTLNVLLSFAQFEREVAAERIRDKVAASKAKGMWMGGGVPLGYEVKDRKLIVVPEEAATVRDIMRRYLEADSIRTLVEELRRVGIVSKRRTSRSGRTYGGCPIAHGALAWLLKNHIYIGEVVHKGNSYPGEHDAIVDREMFDAVQAKLAERTSDGSAGGPRRRVALLAGMIRDDRGRPMSPCHTRNHGRRYSYYASNMNDDAGAPALRFPAGELEACLRSAVANWLRNGQMVRQLVAGRSAGDHQRFFASCSLAAEIIASSPMAEARNFLLQLSAKLVVSSNSAEASFNSAALFSMAGMEGDDDAIQLRIPTLQASYGHEMRLRLEPSGHAASLPDERFFAVRDELMEMNPEQLEATPMTRLRHMQRMARLSYLDPSVVRAILGGTQPLHLNARSLWRVADLPLNWAEQRKMLRFDAR